MQSIDLDYGEFSDRYIFVQNRCVISNTPELMWGSRFGYISDRTTLDRFSSAVRGEGIGLKVVKRLDLPDERVKAIVEAGRNLPELARRFGNNCSASSRNAFNAPRRAAAWTIGFIDRKVLECVMRIRLPLI